jgi:hypothetical protein
MSNSDIDLLEFVKAVFFKGFRGGVLTLSPICIELTSSPPLSKRSSTTVFGSNGGNSPLLDSLDESSVIGLKQGFRSRLERRDEKSFLRPIAVIYKTNEQSENLPSRGACVFCETRKANKQYCPRIYKSQHYIHFGRNLLPTEKSLLLHNRI